MKSGNGTKLGGAGDTEEDQNITVVDLEDNSNRDGIERTRTKCKGHALRELIIWKQKKDLDAPSNHRMTMSHPCDAAMKKANVNLGCIC